MSKNLGNTISSRAKFLLHLLCFVLIFASSPVIYKLLQNPAIVGMNFPDSSQYLQLAANFAGLDPAQFNRENYIDGAVIRPPLYPLMLAFAFWVGGVTSQAVLVLHFFLFIFALAGCSLLLRGIVNPFITSSILVFSVTFTDYFDYVGVEWAIVSLLLPLSLCISRWLTDSTSKMLYVSMLLAAVVSLIRYEFVWILFYITFLSISHSREAGYRRYVVGITRLGTFLALFFLSKELLVPDQSSLLGALSMHESTKNLPMVGARPITCFEQQYVLRKAQFPPGDFFKNVSEIKVICGASWQSISFDLHRMSFQKIGLSPFTFATEVLSRCYPLFFSLPVLLFFFVRRTRHARDVLSTNGMVCSAIFCMQVGIVSLLNVSLARYYLPALSVMTFGIVLFVYSQFADLRR